MVAGLWSPRMADLNRPIFLPRSSLRGQVFVAVVRGANRYLGVAGLIPERSNRD